MYDLIVVMSSWWLKTDVWNELDEDVENVFIVIDIEKREDFDIIDLTAIVDHVIFDDVKNVNENVIDVWFIIADEIDENDEFDALWFWVDDEITMSWFNIIENIDAFFDDDEVDTKFDLTVKKISV